jgi:hypothetical protein
MQVQQALRPYFCGASLRIGLAAHTGGCPFKHDGKGVVTGAAPLNPHHYYGNPH